MSPLEAVAFDIICKDSKGSSPRQVDLEPLLSSHTVQLARLSSHVFCTSNHVASHFLPVYTAIELIINQSTHRDVVSSHQVQSVTDLRAWFRDRQQVG